MAAGLYHATIVRIDATGGIFVKVPRLNRRHTYGPCTRTELLADLNGTVTAAGGDPAHTHTLTPAPLAVGDRVLVGFLEGRANDVTIIGRTGVGAGGGLGGGGAAPGGGDHPDSDHADAFAPLDHAHPAHADSDHADAFAPLGHAHPYAADDHTHPARNDLAIVDARPSNLTPQQYADAGLSRAARWEFLDGTDIGLTGYYGVQTVAPWSDDSGGGMWQLAYGANGVFRRYGTRAGGWGAWTAA